jgi:putative redox protein
MDLIHILTRGRHDLRGLHARLTGQRAGDDPHRFTSIALHFTLTGAVPAPQIQRAIDLSRQKYCSVWNSMRQDIPFEVSYDVGAA